MFPTLLRPITIQLSSQAAFIEYLLNARLSLQKHEPALNSGMGGYVKLSEKKTTRSTLCVTKQCMTGTGQRGLPEVCVCGGGDYPCLGVRL